jgi:hypothetical protein
MLLKLFVWLQHNWLIVAVNSSVVTASTLEIVHYFSFFLLVGSIVIIDLRILGLAGGRVPAARLARQVFPWMWTGLGFAVVSGFLMFGIDATEYLHNSVFHRKLYMLLFSVIFAMIIQGNVPKWDRLTSIPLTAKMVAVLSLVCSIGTILMGVDVPALTGVG